MDNIKEEMSSLMDGENTRYNKDDLIEQMLRDPDASKTWQHFQLIRNALQNKLSPGQTMVERVRSVIDQENLYQQQPHKTNDDSA